jgi:predicted dehydrogenase
MAQAYAAVLRTQNANIEVVGRSARSAVAFTQDTGLAVREGGLKAYLAGHKLAASDPVVVALPIPDLAEATIDLVEAGARRLLIEKPAGLTAEEIERVASVAGRHSASVFVAYNRRFFASVEAARELIAADGGATSFHFEFTELTNRVVSPGKDPAVLRNWFLANSSHVVDLAFHLGGVPESMQSEVAGSLAWHPSAAVFSGHGRTLNGALFSYNADWGSAGRWGVDIRTAKRRLVLQPLEGLKTQDKSGFTLTDVPLDDDLDRRYKPGLYRQVEAFLSSDPTRTALPEISTFARLVRQCFLPILQGTDRCRIGETSRGWARGVADRL